jgi:hypothetical protein
MTSVRIRTPDTAGISSAVGLVGKGGLGTPRLAFALPLRLRIVNIIALHRLRVPVVQP